MPANTLTFAELLNRFEAIANITGAQVTIGVRDSRAAQYTRVLEYGSIVGQPPWPSPGPRTALAADLESGAQVVVSAQAPQGFIRSQVPGIPSIVAGELAAPADWLDAENLQAHVRQAALRSAAQTLESIRAAVPRESGRLAESIEILAG